MVSDDAFDPRRASASSAAAASASAAVPPPSTLATESPFMASTPLAWARPATSGSRPPAPRLPAAQPPLVRDELPRDRMQHGLPRDPSDYYSRMQLPHDPASARPYDGVVDACAQRDASYGGIPSHAAPPPYVGIPSHAAPPSSGPHGASVQVPFGGPYPAPYVAPPSYASSSTVPYEAPYGAPYAAHVPYVASLQPYGVPHTAPYGHHQHYRPSPSADALIPYSAPPTYDSQLSASVAEPGPFHFAHLVTVKLSADNYLLWRAQVLPLMRSH
nr:vegetative cell wall protein gp1-like [Aegilops tauschii subsp. strangulata]